MRISLAVFDMVGTTVRAGDEVPSSFMDAFRSLDVTLSKDSISRLRGRSKREAIGELLSEHGLTGTGAGEEVEEVYGRFRAALQAAYRKHAQAIPGVENVFRFLQRAEVKVVLTTGLDRETAQILFDGLGWGGLGLSGMVTGDEVSRGRPAPDLIYSAMTRVGVTDERCVAVIGDTTSDLDAATEAGVGWSIGVLTGAHTRSQLETRPHSAVLDSVEDLPHWLEAVGAL